MEKKNPKIESTMALSENNEKIPAATAAPSSVPRIRCKPRKFVAPIVGDITTKKEIRAQSP
jgi:hypothetical protein